MLIEQLNARRRPARPAGRAGHHEPALGRQGLRRAGARRCCASTRSRRSSAAGRSASRKEVLPVVEREQRPAVLSEPVRRRGTARRTSIYTGATPQQQALPAIDYLRGAGPPPLLPGRHRLRLSAHHQRGHQGLSRRATASAPTAIVDERYAPFGETPTGETLVRATSAASPRGERAAIVATVSGDANLHFFRELARQGVARRHHAGDDAVDRRGRAAGSRCARTSPAIWSPGAICSAIDTPREPRLRRRLAPLHRRAERRSPTIRWKRPGSASISGRRRSRAAGTTESTRCARRSAGRRINAPSGFTVQAR